MQLFQVAKIGMYGDFIDGSYFVHKENALNEFEGQLRAYRSNPMLATDLDAIQHHMASQALVVRDAPPHTEYIKDALICLWSESEEDCHVFVEHLVILPIETKDQLKE